jgi:4-diphosphocytidyl-2-C-methyl-D-erythritol kinase
MSHGVLQLAPAKINLTLEVLARRDGGYHGIRSVMVPLALADELAIDPAPSFSFECDRGDLSDERNLAVRAVRALEVEPNAALRLRKRIPSEAGLGGGSSDAAAVLRAAMEGAFGSLPARDWIAVARSLGSDVPFFLAGTGALVEGTGERVTAIGALPAWHALVVKPPAGVSTATAYAELDKRERVVRPRNESVSLRMVEALQRGDFAAVEALMHNDFQDAISALVPEVRAALDALRSAGATKALLAGSGSCVFTISPDAQHVAAVDRALALDATYRRFVTAFAPTPAWRT